MAYREGVIMPPCATHGVGDSGLIYRLSAISLFTGHAVSLSTCRVGRSGAFLIEEIGFAGAA